YFVLKIFPLITWHCQSDYCVNFYENITAEAGLCVEISCSFITSSYFKPTNLVWYKCESSRSKCGDSDIILHTNNENKVQSRFRGRVSLLEPKLHHGNCSIIISNLQESDSGSYQLRVNGYKHHPVPPMTHVSSALQQKPTLVVPPLTEGQQTTLTCTAPGLCPGSPPNITWRWRGEEEEDFNITGNITAVTQTHSSTLTFNPSAEHHGTNITCKISFTGDTTTEETVTLNVTCEYNFLLYRLFSNGVGEATENLIIQQEGDALTLTCTADSSPPPLITWTKLGFNTSLVNRNGSLIIPNVTAGDSGLCVNVVISLYNLKKKSCVTDQRSLRISGETAVVEGQVLNLTCSIDSWPLSFITWTKPGFSSKNGTGAAALVIYNVTAVNGGLHVCTAEYLNKTLREEVNIEVKSEFFFLPNRI
uniref:Ig-like domain-containing protein n=1 Tax=Nothobranchius furzeri TaxID=105023 RepID=A0A8C6LV04_NOTFU